MFGRTSDYLKNPDEMTDIQSVPNISDKILSDGKLCILLADMDYELTSVRCV